MTTTVPAGSMGWKYRENALESETLNLGFQTADEASHEIPNITHWRRRYSGSGLKRNTAKRLFVHLALFRRALI